MQLRSSAAPHSAEAGSCRLPAPSAVGDFYFSGVVAYWIWLMALAGVSA
ncbi:hypothetical protein ABH920_002085 [Catenulispora sp. EB89]